MVNGLRRKGAVLAAKLTLLLLVSVVMLVVCELTVRAFVTVRNVGPSFTTYSPVYGRQLRPSISVTRITPEFAMRFSTNAQGFRQPDEVPSRSGPVLFLGDSFTMGYGVNDGEEFVAIIRDQEGPSKGPLLNAGMGDNGNGRWLKFLTHEAPRYEPRLVVLQVMGNDFKDNHAEKLFALQNGELVERPVPPPGLREWAQLALNAVPSVSQWHLISLLRQVRPPGGKPKVKGSSNKRPEAYDELTFRLVDRAIALCQQHGWPVLGLSVGLEGPRLERMKQIFGEHHVQLLQAPSRESRPELYYEIDGHWNARGHAYMAEMITEALPR